MVHWLCSKNLHCHITVTQSPQLTLRSLFVYLLGSSRWIMAHTYHGIRQTNDPKISVLQLLLQPHPTTWSHCPHSFVFSRTSYSWDDTVCIVAFSDWLLPLSNMHSSFLHVFPWLTAHFFLALNNSPLSGLSTLMNILVLIWKLKNKKCLCEFIFSMFTYLYSFLEE